MLEKVLDIQKIEGGQYFRVISRQEGTLEDCKEFKTYYENLQEELDFIKNSDIIKKAKKYDEYHYDQKSTEGVYAHAYVRKLQQQSDELLNKSKEHDNLKSERDQLKSKIEKIREQIPWMERDITACIINKNIDGEKLVRYWNNKLKEILGEKHG